MPSPCSICHAMPVVEYTEGRSRPWSVTCPNAKDKAHRCRRSETRFAEVTEKRAVEEWEDAHGARDFEPGIDDAVTARPGLATDPARCPRCWLLLPCGQCLEGSGWARIAEPAAASAKFRVVGGE
jgi:hypothetical protein